MKRLLLSLALLVAISLPAFADELSDKFARHNAKIAAEFVRETKAAVAEHAIEVSKTKLLDKLGKYFLNLDWEHANSSDVVVEVMRLVDNSRPERSVLKSSLLSAPAELFHKQHQEDWAAHLEKCRKIVKLKPTKEEREIYERIDAQYKAMFDLEDEARGDAPDYPIQR